MLMFHISPPADEPYDLKASAESLVVGRSSRADLVIADRALSREHARIFKASQGWFVEDLGSRNGTFMNGERVRQIHSVAPGDVLALGGSLVRILEVEAKTDSEARAASESRVHYRDAGAVLEDSRITQVEMESRDSESLRRYAAHLHLLNDVHQDLCRSMEIGELMEMILDRVFDHLNPEQGAIYLRAPDGTFQRCAGRSKAPGGEEFVFSEELLREVVEGGKAALVQDARSEDRFVRALCSQNEKVTSLLAAPLMDSVGSLGMIALTSNASLRQFTEADMELLVSLASAAALRTRNMALAREAREKAVLEEELSLARTIQVALLPKTLPEIPGYDVDAHGLPSRRVSGDYYEVVDRPGDGRCFFMIVDVSGKGIGASLMAASLEALCAAPMEAGLEPGAVFDRVSDLLFRRSKPERYATSPPRGGSPTPTRGTCRAS